MSPSFFLALANFYKVPSKMFVNFIMILFNPINFNVKKLLFFEPFCEFAGTLHKSYQQGLN
jgi:hypothetical protein